MVMDLLFMSIFTHNLTKTGCRKILYTEDMGSAQNITTLKRD